MSFQSRASESDITYAILQSHALNWNMFVNWNDTEDQILFQLLALSVSYFSIQK